MNCLSLLMPAVLPLHAAADGRHAKDERLQSAGSDGEFCRCMLCSPVWGLHTLSPPVLVADMRTDSCIVTAVMLGCRPEGELLRGGCGRAG